MARTTGASFIPTSVIRNMAGQQRTGVAADDKMTNDGQCLHAFDRCVGVATLSCNLDNSGEIRRQSSRKQKLAENKSLWNLALRDF